MRNIEHKVFQHCKVLYTSPHPEYHSSVRPLIACLVLFLDFEPTCNLHLTKDAQPAPRKASLAPQKLTKTCGAQRGKADCKFQDQLTNFFVDEENKGKASIWPCVQLLIILFARRSFLKIEDGMFFLYIKSPEGNISLPDENHRQPHKKVRLLGNITADIAEALNNRQVGTSIIKPHFSVANLS